MSGDGFKIKTEQRARFIADGVPPERMPLVVAGTDVTESQSNTYALDFFDIETEDELHDRFPGVHRYLFDHVKPERDENDREQYRLNWWRFAEPRPRQIGGASCRERVCKYVWNSGGAVALK